MTAPTSPSYAGHRFPAEIISYAVWLYFRFPLSLRHVDEILAAHDQISNLFHLRRDHLPANQYRADRTRAFQTWAEISGIAALA